MALSRYASLRGPIPNTTTMSVINARVRRGVITGAIATETIVLEENRRLDQIAGSIYGNSSYWWVIAAASGIGWGLQLPEGTIVVIPTDLGAVLSYFARTSASVILS